MRINKIDYKSYGKLKDKTITLSKGINVIYGENEAGKSTIFDSIKTLIYGFSPANRDQHPYTNWETNDIAFSAEIDSQKGNRWVERQLKSAPKLTFLDKEGSKIESKRNDALEESQSISDKLYDSIFHVTSEDLLELESDSWDHIQDKLIANFGMDYLRKPSEVLESLEKEIGVLWRPTKRGNPLIRQYESELRALQKERRDAMEQYEWLARKEDQLAHLNDGLKKSQDEKRVLQGQIKEIRDLLPVKNKLNTIEWLKGQIEMPEAYAAIDENALSQMNHLKKTYEETRALVDQLKAEKEELIKSKEPISQEDRKLLLHQESFGATLASINALDQVDRKMSDALMKHEENQSAIDAEFQLIFDKELSQASIEDYRQAMVNLNPYELKSNLFKYMEMAESNAIERDKRHLMSQQKRRENGILMGVSAIVLLVIVVFLRPYLAYVAWLPLLAMGYAGAHLLQGKKSHGSLYDLQAFKQEVMEEMLPLELPDYVWGDKSFLIVNKLEKLSRLWIDNQKLKASMQALADEKLTLQQDIRDRLSFMTFDKDREIRLTYNMFKVRLDESLIKERNHEKIDIKIENCQSKIQQCWDKLEALESQTETIHERFKQLGQGDLDKGIALYRRNRQLDEKCRLHEEELLEMGLKVEAYKGYNDKDLISEGILQEREGQLQDLLDHEKELLIQKTSLESDIHHIKENDILDEIDSQMMVLKDKIAEAERDRNRMMVLSEIIHYADDQFRKENQPDILKAVSHYLSIMTNEKYTHVMINDGYELQIVVDGEVKSLANAFSKGTISQLYLAFRLAVIQMMSQSQETLPIVLDEALINWDENRFKQTMKLLEAVSEKHQVIMFTCHEWLAERMGDNIIRLES